MISPYHNLPIDQWLSKTYQLIEAHPINTQELFEITQKSWTDIFNSNIGSKPFRIGTDIFPAPQIMGFLLHELIPLELAHRFPELWRKSTAVDEKDIVYLPDSTYSIELKTSSSAQSIYGNRSYAQASNTIKKSKSGYYLAVNFEKFSAKTPEPKIIRVRFGWLDHEDWIGQSAATGQQARLSPLVERNKLVVLPTRK